MPRPRHCRHVTTTPVAGFFKPRGIPLRELEVVTLTIEGLEALRLADLLGLTAAEAAEHMRVSRHTFGRVLAEARRVVAEALVGGLALCIDGGHFVVADTKKQAGECPARELSMNMIAVSSEGPTLDDLVDPRFGRAGGFVIVNAETLEHAYLDNGDSQAMGQGAGIQAAEKIAAAGAGVLLTGFVGPKAFSALAAAGVKIGQNLEGLTVREAVARYTSGQVPMAEGPNR